MRDLSHHHGPLGPVDSRSPALGVPTVENVEGHSPGNGHTRVEKFQRDGFVQGIPLLGPEAVETLRRDVEGLMAPDCPGRALFHEVHANEAEHDESVLFHALGAWRIAPGFHDLLWNSTLIRVSEELLGGPVRFWHDQLFCKPAHHGGVVAWHQDYSYWTRTVPMAHLTWWIALDDSHVDNGALHVVPKSHRWDLLPSPAIAGRMDALCDGLRPDQRSAFHPTPLEMPSGTASVHHPLTVHGSFENHSDRPRRAAVINVCRDGTRSDTDEPLLRGIPVVPPGQPLSGRFFPRLSS